ncbi:hypothetical protein JAAARDRAFT_189303 [Jaapia argillacea MUCL 33604]|uniref:Uncharacterized protein n=1 Tax=Jaapia argillacea MUCL 33604 TaxID=933084 RepID=A0A067QC77_9AGAM|nr:hypothetical protein JAAARDRAFT_189303 [Jaapia argillacea MUCL 33604]
MSHSSDTESESEDDSVLSLGTAGVVGFGTGTPERSQQTVSVVGDPRGGVIDAIMTLSSLDLSLLRESESSHESIQRASQVILDHLDVIIGGNTFPDTDTSTLLVTFTEIVNHQFMQLLFEYRRIFRSLAATNLASRGTASSVVVCWVDLIIAKLAEAILLLSGGLEYPDFAAGGLNQRRESNGIRAASQLPGSVTPYGSHTAYLEPFSESWADIIPLIASTLASPAAIRLALYLVFGVYVMGPQLKVISPWSSESCKPCQLMSHLGTRIDMMADSHDHWQSNHSQQEKVCFAMAVVLFSAADLAKNEHNDDSLEPFLPRTLSSVSRLIQIIIPLSDSNSAFELISPVTELDHPQAILVHWGATMAWSWSTWAGWEGRIHNTHSTIHLTATWLFHLHTSGPDSSREKLWRPHLRQALLLDVSAAAKSINTVLQQFVTFLSLKDSTSFLGPGCPLLDVLMKLLWSAVQLAEPEKSTDQSLRLDLCTSLLSLFILLGNASIEIHAEVKDTIIETMTLMEPETISMALEKCKNDMPFHFALKLDGCIKDFTSRLSEHLANGSVSQSILSESRMHLHLLTVIWYSGIKGCLHRQTVTNFLAPLVDWSLCQNIHYSAHREFLASLLTSLAFLESTRAGASVADVSKLWDDDALWRLVLASRKPDLSKASALAHYVSETANLETCDRLCFAEAWDFLRDVLLLILTNHFLGEEELLALTVSPSICRALSVLLANIDAGTGDLFRFT